MSSYFDDKNAWDEEPARAVATTMGHFQQDVYLSTDKNGWSNTILMGRCVRCGLRRQIKKGRANLCADCRLVASDLDELERWTA